MVLVIDVQVKDTEWHKKNGNFLKTKSKKENLLTEIEPLQLAF